jgi:hypothetical protein
MVVPLRRLRAVAVGPERHGVEAAVAQEMWLTKPLGYRQAQTMCGVEAGDQVWRRTRLVDRELPEQVLRISHARVLARPAGS